MFVHAAIVLYCLTGCQPIGAELSREPLQFLVEPRKCGETWRIKSETTAATGKAVLVCSGR